MTTQEAYAAWDIQTLPDCCIGEFVDLRSGVFYYRRYDLQITNDENDEGKITIQIYETEYSIDEGGNITQVDHFEPVHELQYI